MHSSLTRTSAAMLLQIEMPLKCSSNGTTTCTFLPHDKLTILLPMYIIEYGCVEPEQPCGAPCWNNLAMPHRVWHDSKRISLHFTQGNISRLLSGESEYLSIQNPYLWISKHVMYPTSSNCQLQLLWPHHDLKMTRLHSISFHYKFLHFTNISSCTALD